MPHRIRALRALCNAVMSFSFLFSTFLRSTKSAYKDFHRRRVMSTCFAAPRVHRHVPGIVYRSALPIEYSSSSEAAATDCATHRRLQLMYDRSHWRRRRIRQQPRMQSSSARRAWAAEAPSVQRHPLAAPRADRYTFTFDCRSSRTEGLCEFKPGD
jgi:hypothetical protein